MSEWMRLLGASTPTVFPRIHSVRCLAYAVIVAVLSIIRPPVSLATTTQPANLISARSLDLDGHIHSLPATDRRTTVVIFLSPECPIARRAVPTLNALAKDWSEKSVSLVGVFSDPSLDRVAAAKFAGEFGVLFPIVLDPGGELARQFQPRRTPEAFVLTAAGAIVYRGRIDDSFVAVGKANAVVKAHDLADAVGQSLAGQLVVNTVTEPVGCAFEAWSSANARGDVTWTRDVAPIVFANCVSCHREGQIAPFSLTSYDSAKKHAKQIAAVVESKLMPPWKAEAGFGHFKEERRLHDGEIALLSKWAAADAPRGDGDEPKLVLSDAKWSLGVPDIVVELPVDYEVPAAGRDEYRAFVLPLNLKEDVYVAGFEFRPGAPTVVHHALLFLDTNGTARKRQESTHDGRPGFPGTGAAVFATGGGLGGWAPGASPYLLPEGQGRAMKAGSDLILQVHYHPDGASRKDRFTVGLYLQKKPVTQVVGSFPLGTRAIDIAPGDTNYTRAISATLPSDSTLVGIAPHMHLIGRKMKAVATKPDGTTVPLVNVTDWDFKWQDQYRFAEPIKLPAGTRIDVTARYDNSAANPNNPSDPPARVRRGEQTTDEMCLCFVTVVADSSAELASLRRGVLQDLMLRQSGLGGGRRAR